MSPRRSCSRTCKRLRSSTRARCSRRCTRKSSASSAARPSRPWWAITNSAAGPEDIELLERISQVAAAAHAPFLSAASSDLLNLGSYTQLGSPRDIGKVFDSTEYAKWKSLRQSEDSRYLALTLPHILMRLPYGKETKQVEAFDFEEQVEGTRSLEVSVGQCGVWTGRAADQLLREVRLVRGHPRGGGRWPGGWLAGAYLPHR